VHVKLWLENLKRRNHLGSIVMDMGIGSNEMKCGSVDQLSNCGHYKRTLFYEVSCFNVGMVTQLITL
jgi:hypothetical protein